MAPKHGGGNTEKAEVAGFFSEDLQLLQLLFRCPPNTPQEPTACRLCGKDHWLTTGLGVSKVLSLRRSLRRGARPLHM